MRRTHPGSVLSAFYFVVMFVVFFVMMLGVSSVISTSAWAAETDDAVIEVGGGSEVTLADAIGDAPTDGSQTTIKLMDDVTIEKILQIGSGKNIIVDLNGNAIKVTKQYLQVRGSLIIKDCATGGSIEGVVGCSVSGVIQLDSSSARVLLENGTISNATTGEGSAATAVRMNKPGSTFSMTGGKLEAPLPVKVPYASTVEILEGEIVSNGDSETAIDVDVSGSSEASAKIVVGQSQGGDGPTIEGIVSFSGKAADVQFNCGVVKGVTGQIPPSATLNCMFESDVSDSLPAGKQCVVSGNEWMVEALEEADAEAKIVRGENEEFYASVYSAGASLQDGDRLVLLQNATSHLVLSDVTATVDLNGHTLTGDESPVVRLTSSNASITVENGGIALEANDADGAIIGVYGDEFAPKDVALNLIGVNLAMTGSGNAGIIVHGNNTRNSISLKDCSLKVPDDVMGIYFPPADSTLTIADSSIEAGTGVGIKGGTLSIRGNTVITAKGDGEIPSEGASSGIAETGDAIYVEGNYTDRAVTVSIEGGTFSSAHGQSVRMLFNENRTEETPAATVSVSGGKFSGGVDEEYLAPGAKYDEETDEVVVSEDVIASVESSDGVVLGYYTSLQSAIDSLAEGLDGGAVTLLSNTTGDGVIVPESTNCTLDLGGFKYTVGETVGSSGTETNGFQLLKDSSITIKNGTITSETAKILIQNYSNLTLEDVNLVGGPSTQYTLSNNNGDTLIGKGTNIYAGQASPKVAIDVYSWPSNGYESVNVTIGEDAGVVEGTIVVSSDGAGDGTEEFSLKINGGNLSQATVELGSGSEDATVSKGAGVELANPEGTVAIVTAEDGGARYFPSLQSAVDGVEVNGTVSLVGDAEGPIVIDKAITLEGNGHIITAETGDAITVTAGGVTLLNVRAVAKSGIALSAGTESAPVDGIVVAGGSYENVVPGKQGEGSIRVYSSSGATVVDTATVGGIQVLKADESGNVVIKGNAVRFTTDGDAPLVGVLVWKEADASGNASAVMEGNSISVPNKDSVYVQYGIPDTTTGSWVFEDDEQILASGSVAAIEGVYFLTLQDALDIVESGQTITLVAPCDEVAMVGREVSFALEIEKGVSFSGSIKAEDGYVVSEKDGVYTVEEYTYVPPASDPDYAVEVPEAEHGSVAVSPERAEAGEEVVVTAEPDEGYLVGSVEVVDADGKAVEVEEGADGAWSFEMPEGGAAVSVSFVWDNPYTDVPEGEWFLPAVEYATVNGLMRGYAPEFDAFGPYDYLTRAQMVQVLYNMAGSPEASYAGTFPDVAASSDYADAIGWAVAEGIATGYDDTGRFEPDKPVAREEMAVFMCRYAAWEGADVSADASALDAFPDADELSPWAVEGMAWAVENGVINGVGGELLEPLSTSVRAYAAQMLMNYLEA